MIAKHVVVDIDLSDNKLTMIKAFPAMPVQSVSFKNNKILQIEPR
jgi:hypothetical protein